MRTEKFKKLAEIWKCSAKLNFLIHNNVNKDLAGKNTVNPQTILV